jgi:hypothetical protein
LEAVAARRLKRAAHKIVRAKRVNAAIAAKGTKVAEPVKVEKVAAKLEKPAYNFKNQSEAAKFAAVERSEILSWDAVLEADELAEFLGISLPVDKPLFQSSPSPKAESYTPSE